MRDVCGNAEVWWLHPLPLLRGQSAASGCTTVGVRIAQPLRAAASDQGYDVGGVLAER